MIPDLARRSLAAVASLNREGKASGVSGCCPDRAADLPAAGGLRPALQVTLSEFQKQSFHFGAGVLITLFVGRVNT
jgi:hypothetical protein